MAFDPHNLEKKIKAEASSAFLSTGFHAQLVENYNYFDTGRENIKKYLFPRIIAIY